MVMDMPRSSAGLLATEPIRPLKRAEYERLAAAGYFEDEKVELLFGMVVVMTPIDPSHNDVDLPGRRRGLDAGLRESRDGVRAQSSFAASEMSEPEPDVFVIPRDVELWTRASRSRALLVVEVCADIARSRPRDRRSTLYGSCSVDEYWIVNHPSRSSRSTATRSRVDWRIEDDSTAAASAFTCWRSRTSRSRSTTCCRRANDSSIVGHRAERSRQDPDSRSDAAGRDRPRDPRRDRRRLDRPRDRGRDPRVRPRADRLAVLDPARAKPTRTTRSRGCPRSCGAASAASTAAARSARGATCSRATPRRACAPAAREREQLVSHVPSIVHAVTHVWNTHARERASASRTSTPRSARARRGRSDAARAARRPQPRVARHRASSCSARTRPTTTSTRKAATLRKQFERVKERLRELAEQRMRD